MQTAGRRSLPFAFRRASVPHIDPGMDSDCAMKLKLPDSAQQSKRIPVAVVVPRYGLVGGGEEHTAELTNRLSQHEAYDVHLFANKFSHVSETVCPHKIPIISFPKFLTTASFAYFAQTKMAERHFDIVHTHERIFQADLTTLHWIPHRIWIRDVRKKRIPSLYDRATISVERRLARSARVMAAVSQLVKEKFLDEYPDTDPDRISVIHPGVDVEQFSKPDRQRCRHAVRDRYGIQENDLVVLFVSMNHTIKGLDYLMGGIAQFRKDHPEEHLKLLIVGNSDHAQYLALARILGIHHDVIYAGVIPHEQIAEFYLASDLFAQPSRFDTFGLTVLEAMAAALPVIVSTTVGAKDLVRHGENGFIIDHVNHEEQIVHALRLLSNKGIRGSISHEALKTASRHRWEASLEKYLILYQQISAVKAASLQHLTDVLKCKSC
jgi:UDP-glucose:(heptosyl)LPS alpha-1,3-glucosyltransferase